MSAREEKIKRDAYIVYAELNLRPIDVLRYVQVLQSINVDPTFVCARLKYLKHAPSSYLKVVCDEVVKLEADHGRIAHLVTALLERH